MWQVRDVCVFVCVLYRVVMRWTSFLQAFLVIFFREIPHSHRHVKKNVCIGEEKVGFVPTYVSVTGNLNSDVKILKICSYL